MKNNLRKLTTLAVLLLAALFVFTACGNDDNKNNQPGENNHAPRYLVSGGEISLTHNGVTHTANSDTTGQVTRLELSKPLTTALRSQWGEAGKLPYEIRTNVILTEAPGKKVEPGEYEIHDQKDILLQNKHAASVSLFSGDMKEVLELPSGITAVSGTMKYELIGDDYASQTGTYTFDADFRSDDEKDDKTYKVSGKITVLKQLAHPID